MISLPTGPTVRIIDIGLSYRKLCNHPLNGRFMNLGPKDINVNPFTTIGLDDEEKGVQP
ncbi:hypothetical protein [Geobacter sp. FeAm09]|uniref:hypothetical protein n=1 Tax=Geobacter sp. FeAm09 TaxID=2597769 RepID=UPI00143D9027|nr:hypothetical protein [Geobacter sp. FeAm09]